MTSFREIPVNIITHDTVMGRSMHNIDHAAHEKLDRQMREWERTNKVTVVPMGASAESNPLRVFSDSNIVDNSKKRNKAIRKSGHQNIITRESGKHTVQVGAVCCGTFTDIEKAIKARDRQRAAQGMKKAEY